MASLTIPNIFTAGTPALASEVNANFTAVVNWSTGLDQDNMATFTGDLAFTIANGNAIVIQNNGNDESIKITQGALLGAGKASILITDGQTQTNANAAELKMVLAAGATIPAVHITHGVDTFKLTKDYLRLEALLKPPVRTTSQRNAIVSPEEGSVIYNSTNQELNIKQNATWAPVGCPVGSVQMFAGASAPQGWLLCNGDTVPNGSGTVQTITADYSQLYAILGSTYGSAGKLPDIRGMFVRGAGTHGSAIGGFTPTGTLGTEEADTTAVNGLSVTTDGTHAHTTTNSGTAGGAYTDPALRLTWTSDSSFINTYTTSSAGSHTHPLTGDTETRPVNIALNYIIKY